MQPEVLGYVEEHPGSSPSAIAKALGLTPSTVHAQLAQLVKKQSVFNRRGKYYSESNKTRMDQTSNFEATKDKIINAICDAKVLGAPTLEGVASAVGIPPSQIESAYWRALNELHIISNGSDTFVVDWEAWRQERI